MSEKIPFRGNEVSCSMSWPDDYTFAFDIGDGEFTDSDGDDYFIHFEYHAYDDEWVVEVCFENEALQVGFPGSDKYITEEEIQYVEEGIRFVQAIARHFAKEQ